MDTSVGIVAGLLRTPSGSAVAGTIVGFVPGLPERCLTSMLNDSWAMSHGTCPGVVAWGL